MGPRWVQGPFVFVSHDKARSLEANLATPGDIVFTQRGTLGQVCLVPDEPYKRYLISQSQMKATLNPGLADPSFVYHLYTSQPLQETIRQNAIQTGVPHINLGILRQLPVLCPPVTEQRAVATVISDVDALVSSLDKLIAKKRDLKQAAMQQLLTGKTRLPGFGGKWEVKRMGECLLSSPDYGINAPAAPYSDVLPTYLRITDISDDGRFNPAPKVSVDSPYSEDYLLQEGDVVFARTGASVGKSYRYCVQDGPLVFAGFLIRVRPNPKILMSDFLAASVTTKSYWNWVRLMSMRSGQPGINGNEYATLPLLLPGIEEQTAIAEVLSDMDTELAALEAQRDKTSLLKQGMMQELLTGKTRLV
ncbi:Putative type-1 restriction enzyme [Burkholderia pseudomallei]|nr:Putative type-1 restriction enzyme [Burkholderia pseudomallei]